MSDKIKLKILYVEDEPTLRERISIILSMHFESVKTAANGLEALELFTHERPDIVVSDIQMPLMDGLEMTKRIRDIAPETPVILGTAFTETDHLIKAIELGVFAYVRKPIDCRKLVETITRAAEPVLHKAEMEQVRQGEQAALELLLGNSPAMRDVIRQSQRISRTDYSLIIQGETGVGKSHLASVIHGLSLRRQHPFITVNLGSLPETLAESALFGHVKGAFTGADSSKKGLFEEAHGGTIFLDDVDCAPAAIQAKILHAVEVKRFYPVGGTQAVTTDIRVIAASNRELLHDAQAGNFREDLYYRLSDLVITVPPLRDRGEDILPLARFFLNNISLELGQAPPRMTPEAGMLLCRYQWPGNIRQIKSVMKRAVLFAGEIITHEDFEAILTNAPLKSSENNTFIPMTLEEIKCQAVRKALAATDGKKMEAARILDVDYSSFKRMLDRYSL
ncbi:MAG: sigma-54-dependent transcriptional regulator [Desulfuromonadaceae bacterium]